MDTAIFFSTRLMPTRSCGTCTTRATPCNLARRPTNFAPRDTMKKTPEYDKLDVYFNDDSGSGKFRAVSALGNAQLAAIFQSWITPIKDLGIETVVGLTAGPTKEPGGTDS